MNSAHNHSNTNLGIQHPRKNKLASFLKVAYALSLLLGSSLILFQPVFWYISSALGVGSLITAAFCGITFLMAAQYNHSKSFEKRQGGVIMELQKRLTHYKELMANTNQLVSEFNNSGHLIFANKSFCDLLGIENYTENEIHFNDLVPSWYISSQQEFFKAQRKQGKKETLSEVPFISKDGEVKWIEQRNLMLFDQDGNVIKTTCIGRNITKQKNTEKTLIEAKETAIKSSLVKAQFLSSMSHEIRTPMNAVIGLIYLMMQENPRPDQKDHLETLKFSAENLLELINDILDFSKIEAGKIEINKTDLSLEEIIRFIHHGFNSRAIEKGIGLSLNYDESLPAKLIGDSLRLSQIMNNLVSNAIKFTDEGGVNISIQKQRETSREVEIFFSVEDTGIGIPSDKLSSIFEDFTQVTESDLRQGTGLGLSITKELLRLQGSEIKVDSVYGKGSIFYFTLTFEKSVKSQAKLKKVDLSTISNPKSKSGALSGVRVLLVEDNKINQKVTKKFLTKWGVETVIADNGKIAVDLVQMTDFDLLLMDMQMPIMDGIEATKAIRGLGGKYENIPIIALTASAVLGMKKNAINSGLDDFVTKPFTPDVLFKKISTYSNKSKSPQLLAQNS